MPASLPGTSSPRRAACTPAERLAWAVSVCTQTGLRLTPNRRRVLAVFAGERSPINLDAVAHADELRGRCDTTTIYRTLMLFCQAGLLRMVNLQSKSRFFVLNMPGDAHDHLVCRRCGMVVCLPGLPVLDQLARELAESHGFSGVRHELEFHGLCPACHAATRHEPPVTKLPRSLRG